MKISIQGYKGSFHDTVANILYPNEQIVERSTFDEVYEDVRGGSSELGISAIENSIAGSIMPNYDLLLKNGLQIVGEYYLRIEHFLMALPGQKLEEIEEVRSHPMAIAQCLEYLKKLDVKVVETDDTAGSAKEIQLKGLKKVAAISPKRAAALYGQEILAESIETDKQNYTRFLVLAKEASHTGKEDKVSVALTLKHEPGSLAKVINTFADNKINMTKIQSRPIIGEPFNYRFFIDYELNPDTNSDELEQLLKERSRELTILGKYKKAEITS